MRRAGPLAAVVLLGLAFSASGCKPSSLTPFGIGTQNYETGGQNVNGLWSGKTASGGEARFQVGDNTVSRLHFTHVTASCTLTFEDLTTQPAIVDGGFSIEIHPPSQGRFVATATFTTATTCSGSYFFEALPAGDCPSAGNGTFVVEKNP